MPRVASIDPANAPATVAPQLAAIRKAVGFVPNFFRQAAVSPAALKGYLAFNEALSQSSLPAATREAIALGVAEANGCDYCLSAHSAVAQGQGLLDDRERALARVFQSTDPARAAALAFARAALEARGHVSDAAFQTARDAGLTDEALLDVIAVVSINIFTNYLNDAVQIEVDFPPVRAGVPG